MSAQDLEFTGNSSTGYSFYESTYLHCGELNTFHGNECNLFGASDECQYGMVTIDDAYYVSNCSNYTVSKWDGSFTYSQKTYCCDSDECNTVYGLNDSTCVENSDIATAYTTYYQCALSYDMMTTFPEFGRLLFCGGSIATCDDVDLIVLALGQCTCAVMDLFYSAEDASVDFAATTGCPNAQFTCNNFTSNDDSDNSGNTSTDSNTVDGDDDVTDSALNFYENNQYIVLCLIHVIVAMPVIVLYC